MRIHSDWLQPLHLDTATQYATQMVPHHGYLYVGDLEVSKSRSRKWGMTFRLSGDGTHSRRRINTGKMGAGVDYAATWDQWGWVLAFLFDIDPRATVSTGYRYDGFDNYHGQTKGAYLLTDDTARAVLMAHWDHLRETGEGRSFGPRDFYMPKVPVRILREEGY